MKDKIAIYATLVNVVLAAGKVSVGLLARSASITAEGIHSSVDVVSSFIGWIGIKMGKNPSIKNIPTDTINLRFWQEQS